MPTSQAQNLLPGIYQTSPKKLDEAQEGRVWNEHHTEYQTAVPFRVHQRRLPQGTGESSGPACQTRRILGHGP